MSEQEIINELRQLIQQWEQQRENMMSNVDITASHYTGCSGALCLGKKHCEKELQELIEEYE